MRLTEVFRQAAQSRIITSAHRINQGLVPDLSKPDGDSDFYFVDANDPDVAVPRIVELVKSHFPRRFGLDPIRDVQVLCPMNRGGVGARSLNIELQAALNRAGERKVERFGWTFAPGDKIMQIVRERYCFRARRRIICGRSACLFSVLLPPGRQTPGLPSRAADPRSERLPSKNPHQSHRVRVA